MTAPIHISLALAFLLACLLPASALGLGRVLGVGSSTIYSHVSVGENGNLPVCKVVGSEHAGGGIFGFIYDDQKRDRIEETVVDRITAELEFGDGAGGVRARPRYVHVKGARLGSVRGLGDFLKEMISAQAAGPDDDLVDRGLVSLAERERGQAPVVPAESLEGHRPGERSAFH